MKHLFLPIAMASILCFPGYSGNLTEVHKSSKKYNDVKSIDVEGNFCKVVLTSSSEGFLVVKTTIEASKDIEGFGINDQLNGSNLSLAVKTPEEHVSTKSGEIVLQVPPGCTIKVKTSSGYIEAINLKDCPVDAHAIYGRISAENVSGNYKIKTGTGLISVSNLSGQLIARTSSGNIEISDIDGEATVISDKGVIEAIKIKGNFNAQTNTSAQNISNINGGLMLRTSTGELTIKDIEGHLQTINDDGNVLIENLKGTMDLKSISGNLHGEDILLTGNSKFETTKGRIDMALKNDQKELTYNMESSYGVLYIPGKSKKKKLNSGNGPILITTLSNNGAQRFTLAK
jgi:hypothetical protein